MASEGGVQGPWKLSVHTQKIAQALFEHRAQATVVCESDNPVSMARRSGKPTMVEFGTTGRAPCDMMQPTLDKLPKDYPRQLNVVLDHVGEDQILASRYGLRSILSRIF
jgi:thiol-disulfide isomerase/thioredoxin